MSKAHTGELAGGGGSPSRTAAATSSHRPKGRAGHISHIYLPLALTWEVSGPISSSADRSANIKDPHGDCEDSQVARSCFMLETRIFQLCRVCGGFAIRSESFKGTASSPRFLFPCQCSYQTHLQASGPEEPEPLYEDERLLIPKVGLCGGFETAIPEL